MHGAGPDIVARQTAAHFSSWSLLLASTALQAEMPWDWDVMRMCICDSSWRVGLGLGETQEPEWFGADCSLRKLLGSLAVAR